jgi:hypothetical protein
MGTTAKTIEIVDNAAESMMIAFDGVVPSESVAIKWLNGHWSMCVQMYGNDDLFDGVEDFIAAVAAKVSA